MDQADILGSRVCVFSIIRTIQVLSVSGTHFTWNYINLAVWSILETGIGIICPCLVTLRPILRFIFRKFHDPSSAQNYKLTGNAAHTNVPEFDISDPYKRMKYPSCDDEVRIIYHNTRRLETHKLEPDLPLTGILITRDSNVESRYYSFDDSCP